MSMLERDQLAIAATLLDGPGHCPAELFEGDDSIILRGLRVHANSISHARLVALEETFPHARDHLGPAEFNRLSRDFLEAGGAQHCGLADIGTGFPDWLEGSAGTLSADIARIEWAWLEAYHAADALPLAFADLAGCSEADLLAMTVRRHPAARVVHLGSDAAPMVTEDLAHGTSTLLVVRPGAEVRLIAIGGVEAAVVARSEKPSLIGNLISGCAEKHDDGGAAIAALIGAGAFERFR